MKRDAFAVYPWEDVPLFVPVPWDRECQVVALPTPPPSFIGFDEVTPPRFVPRPTIMLYGHRWISPRRHQRYEFMLYIEGDDRERVALYLSFVAAAVHLLHSICDWTT